MSKTQDAVVGKFSCSDCGVPAGELCKNRFGVSMAHSVHEARMICPICDQVYAERSGNGFRHWWGQNVWHRLEKNKIK